MTAVDQNPATPVKNEQTASIDQQSAVLLADALRKHLLLHQQMGIEIYPQAEALQQFLRVRKTRPAQVAVPPPSSASATVLRKEASLQTKPVTSKKTERMSDLYRELVACSRCALTESRSVQVLAQGEKGARLLIVGDYARAGAGERVLFGQAEDALLWKMMQAIKLRPTDVYVTNVVKCSPGEGGTPSPEHEQTCQGYLHREIALVQPALILAMGMSAARAILGVDGSVFRLRGRLHPSRFLGRLGEPLPVMVSFHPRFLLEQPAMKRAAWQDLQIVQRQLQLTGKTSKPLG